MAAACASTVLSVPASLAISRPPSKTFTATAPVNMRRTADAKGALVRTLPPGSIVYPTGQKNGLYATDPTVLATVNGDNGGVLFAPTSGKVAN